MPSDALTSTKLDDHAPALGAPGEGGAHHLAPAALAAAKPLVEIGPLNNNRFPIDVIIPFPLNARSGPLLSVPGDLLLPRTAHASRYLRFTASSPCAATVPADQFQTGEKIRLEQAGAGQLSVVAADGVIVNTPRSLKAAARYAVMMLRCVDASNNVFTLSGELAAS